MIGFFWLNALVFRWRRRQQTSHIEQQHPSVISFLQFRVLHLLFIIGGDIDDDDDDDDEEEEEDDDDDDEDDEDDLSKNALAIKSRAD